MYHFTVEFWDELLQDVKIETGLAGKSSKYSEAAAEVSSYYGEDNIVSMKLYGVESVLNKEEIIEMLESSGEGE